jgi:hypothetical protein
MKQSGRFSQMVAFAAAVACAALVSSAQAVEPGKAVVRAVKGSAQYSEGGTWLSLSSGQVLKAGAVVRTANDSSVDLFMDENGPVVRLMENTTLGIDKLNYEVTGVDTIVETQLDLKSGRLVGIVRKLSATSKYEVKTPNGVAGIRGTEYVISATNEVYVMSGSVVVVHVKGDGSVVTQVVNSGEMFDPASGSVKAIPQDQLGTMLADVNALRGGVVAGGRAPVVPIIFVSPTVGAQSSVKGPNPGN